MKGMINPIAMRALQAARQAARKGPEPRKHIDSRTADKFVLRGYRELFDELAAIGLHYGRSANSEMVAAVLEAQDGFERIDTAVQVLKDRLGPELTVTILDELPDFDLARCEVKAKCVVRLPPQVRDRVREGVRKLLGAEIRGDYSQSPSMNHWFIHALVLWIKYQRQHFALLSAVIEVERSVKKRLEHVPGHCESLPSSMNA